ncbi:group II intron reverse transcriptase/maturase [Syntrophobacter fumaroxidans]|uniref:RNA-directed DNA polymerase (Reverse transcriptase) n=1 Tax=Syntrophobacter fumaroxidans (strain DSM 10017 / MPOB) TaxID=335543 RepID=A0LN71_SYNFM|nr:RNA-directed DNA polymerase (Reverse transcriptase) [Syntrophobacter fumaroxidans MPOB]
MRNGDADSRTGTPGTSSGGSGGNPQGPVACASSLAARRDDSRQRTMQLMEAVVERENMFGALRQVEANKGSAGVDGVSVDALRACLREHWPRIKEELLEGRYQPQPVRKVEIPKPGGKGMRQLGIPTVMDRLIQQALNQVMQPIFDPDFSESSYGFRPGRSAHQAVLRAREYAATDRRWVVDMDLEKFFDRVNHDILMARLARKIADRRVLQLIRRYLQAGSMVGGVVSPRTEGTPQGGPLSPLLSNILLDDLDKELEQRGHAFCRYADDCNIYVKSRRAGQRVLESLTRFLANRLKLKVNVDKSAVARPWVRKFLGYSMTFHKRPRLRVAPAVVDRMKAKLREQFRMGRGRNIRRVIEELTPVLRGWVNYFRLSEVKGNFEELDEWIRRKFRCIIWRQWKRTYTRAKNMMKCGLGEERAWRSAKNQRGPWWNSGASHMNQCFPKRFFERLGLVSLLSQLRRLQCTS